MKEVYVFFENGELKTVFDNFVKFRKTTFHYILSILVNKKFFPTKLEGGKGLKKEFTKFYAKNSEKLIYKDLNWECKKVFLNDLEEESISNNEKENDINNKTYESNFTKIRVIKGISHYKYLNQKLNYIKLSPLYGK
jgi:hypothetical protein